MNAYIQNLVFESKKTNHTFEFGIDRQSIYLQSYVSYPENLKNMGDEFWGLILKLPEYGDFNFVENSGLSSMESQYFNNKKSNLFRLLRNYFLRDINNMELEPHQRNYDMDLGWFELKWKFGTPWTEIIKNGSYAFKILYQLHYELWKISDLKDKKFQRYFPMHADDFYFPAGRTEKYTIIEVSMFEGRSVETKKEFIKLMYLRFREQLDIEENDLEITIFETPKFNWGIRGLPGDELTLNYKVNV